MLLLFAVCDDQGLCTNVTNLICQNGFSEEQSSSPSQRTNVTKEFNFSEFSQDFWLKSLRNRVLVHGGPDEMLYNRAVVLFTETGGVFEECFNLLVPPPKLIIYADETLPEGVKAVDDLGQLHIPLEGSDLEVRERIWAAYRTPFATESADEVGSNESERDFSGARIKIAVHHRLDNDQTEERPRRRRRSLGRTRDMLAVTSVQRRFFQRGNTWGQLLDWKLFKSESPEAWQLFINNQFSAEKLAEFSGTSTIVIDKSDGTVREYEDFPLWKAWLRSLRVMNGLSSEDISILFKSRGGYYSEVETRPSMTFSLESALFVIDRNIFSLPADENGHVMPDYKETFLTMVGHDQYFLERKKNQFFAAVKAVGNAYLRGEITPFEMPSLNELIVRMVSKRLSHLFESNKGSSLKTGRTAPYVFLDQLRDIFRLENRDYPREIDYTPYFALMPYFRQHQNRLVASSVLSREQALKLASNTATSLGKFFRIYRESMGLSLKDVAQHLGLKSQRLHTIESSARHKKSTLDRILVESNPYRFPTSDSGRIRKDVVDVILALYEPKRRILDTKGRRAMAAKGHPTGEANWLDAETIVARNLDLPLLDALTGKNEEHPQLTGFHDLALLTDGDLKGMVPKGELKDFQLRQNVVFHVGGVKLLFKMGRNGECRVHSDGLVSLSEKFSKNYGSID